MEFGFKGYHPTVNVLFFAGAIVFSMLLRHPLTLLMALSASLIYYIKLTGKKAIKTFFCFLLPMLCLVVFINALFAHYGVTPLYTLKNGNSVTLESIVYGGVLGISAVNVMLWFFCYGEVVTSDKFLSLFGKVLPQTALILCMALRFIPLYSKRYKIIYEAQKSMVGGAPRGLISKIRFSGKCISVLITWALENAVQISDSMRARGYGLRGKKSYGKFTWSKKDIVAAGLITGTEGMLTAGVAKQALSCMYNPAIVIHSAASNGAVYQMEQYHITCYPLSPLGIVTLMAFALLCFLPLLIDLKEEIKWKSLQSGM